MHYDGPNRSGLRQPVTAMTLASSKFAGIPQLVLTPFQVCGP